MIKKNKTIMDYISKEIKNRCRFKTTIITRFSPEPNGFLHIGHVKAILVNYSLAKYFNGKSYIRFDDTNPIKENNIYINSILEDIHWLGYKFNNIYYASNYFDKLYEWALFLIKKGKAYVDDLSIKEIKKYRGDFKSFGYNSPYRNRSIQENSVLFKKMYKGLVKEGKKVLRAKIDMKSKNINLRDPIMYRIINVYHSRTGNKWKIYPSYDFAHGQSDILEGITHSICTLEFENNRKLYKWFIKTIVNNKLNYPKQIEFSRMNINYSLTSKRKIKFLIDQKIIVGWDDPRLSTVSGMRRRGYTQSSLNKLCKLTGITRSNNIIDINMQYYVIRSDLENTVSRVMCVINPIKLVLTNLILDYEELINVRNHPFIEMGTRSLFFNREIWIDCNDFNISPTKNFFRLSIGKKVRLRHSYIIKCKKIIYFKNKQIKEIQGIVYLNTKNKNIDGKKIKGVIHWVSVKHGVKVEVRHYKHLLKKHINNHILNNINKNSLKIHKSIGEPILSNIKPETKLQFERVGYYCADRYDYKKNNWVFNKIISLKT
ncbi:Glutamine--tRNA ligase [Candidatus Portiera aleyrodidarum]|uniref:Glutamine--tRNA ligase n=1 Tax=Candidatus Portiera aleyrodidarum TV TaxID=1297582 RepID=A0A8D3X7M7_9GAMM|nr:glutamine--tRNA ligase [Candidatus Portiera aleyrodidarum]AGI27190.1 glutaminyl-tRNA synthetase [Candidatus Portiera aleyrodidarum TV]CEI59174.1 Glutamine--tRNA ligase [Candidatus Portiera aleyrodidarum]